MHKSETKSAKDAGFGLYIHWPYCARICPYCDFNVYKAGVDKDSRADLIRAIATDLSYWRDLSGPRHIDSVHFGGGTPSLLRGAQVSDLLGAIDDLWGLPESAQIALEANPADSDKARWEDWRTAGISRLSLGVQSYDDQVLKFLGRDHNSAQARAALDLAVDIFPHVSADLIYGHKGQTAAHWLKDLQSALGSGAGHISAYQLTIEAGTAFARAQQRGDDPAIGADASADFYELTRDTLTGAGFEHYEVSNFAKAGQQSAHNLIYWRGGDYVGAGPGAHGRLSTDSGRLATVAAKRPADYISSVSSKGHGITDEEILPACDYGAEYVMMGLRINEGISLSRYRAITGEDMNMRELQNLSQQGLITYLTADRVKASPKGRVLLDAICRLLLTPDG